jgi:putative Mg2+ transporter-C (MgtC) family protein
MLAMAVSIICGGLLGLERDYRAKSTGLRTVIMISLGSTVFTLVSHYGTNTSDTRIAANIVTGIGFLGAGVIFKDKVGVVGLTTAAVIWVAAAIGMAAGFGEFALAIMLTIFALIVLMFFGRLEEWVNSLPRNLLITVSVPDMSLSHLKFLEDEVKKHNLNVRRIGISKTDGIVNISFRVKGKADDIAYLQTRLMELEDVKSFR